jgi:O-antigen/teichoic acid export membrane protein
MSSNFISKFIGGILFNTFGDFFRRGSGLIGFMVAARYLSREDLGGFVMLLLTSSVFNILNSLLIDDTATIKVVSSTSGSQRADIANVAIFYKALITLLTCPVIFLLYPMFSETLNLSNIHQCRIFLILLFVAINIEGHLAKLLQGFQEFKKIALARTISGLAKVSLIFLFVVSFDLGIKGLVYSYLFSYCISSALFCAVAPFRYKIRTNWAVYKRILRFGFPLGINGCLTFLFLKIDRIMIGTMIDSSAVAVYETASQTPSYVRMGYVSFQSVFFPSIAELHEQGRIKEIENVLSNSLRIVSFICCFMFLIAFALRTEIITLLFSAKYIESAAILPILSLALCIALPSNLIGTSLVAIGQSEKPAIINTIDAIANTTGNFLLIPIFGIHGAAVATLISRCLTNPLNVWFLNKSGVQVDIWQYLKPLFVCLTGVGIGLIFNPSDLIFKAITILLFPPVCYLFSVVKRDDLSSVFRAIRATFGQVGV